MEKEKKPIIRVKNLYKIYRVGETKVRALDGVDFTLYRGEFCAIVGTSGSGKSTLLNMLAGLEKPTLLGAHHGGEGKIPFHARTPRAPEGIAQGRGAQKAQK